MQNYFSPRNLKKKFSVQLSLITILPCLVIAHLANNGSIENDSFSSNDIHIDTTTNNNSSSLDYTSAATPPSYPLEIFDNGNDEDYFLNCNIFDSADVLENSLGDWNQDGIENIAGNNYEFDNIVGAGYPGYILSANMRILSNNNSLKWYHDPSNNSNNPVGDYFFGSTDNFLCVVDSLVDPCQEDFTVCLHTSALSSFDILIETYRGVSSNIERLYMGTITPTSTNHFDWQQHCVSISGSDVPGNARGLIVTIDGTAYIDNILVLPMLGSTCFSCPTVSEICDNGIDDDGDGLIDEYCIDNCEYVFDKNNIFENGEGNWIFDNTEIIQGDSYQYDSLGSATFYGTPIGGGLFSWGQTGTQNLKMFHDPANNSGHPDGEYFMGIYDGDICLVDTTTRLGDCGFEVCLSTTSIANHWIFVEQVPDLTDQSSRKRMGREYNTGSTLWDWNETCVYIHPDSVPPFSEAIVVSILPTGGSPKPPVYVDNIRIDPVLGPNCFVDTCVVEICDNEIDDDGDGQIDCSDVDCSAITLSNLVVSGCIDQPLRDVATVSVDVSWGSHRDSIIEIRLGDKIEYIFGIPITSSPQTIDFIVPADGTFNNEIIAYWGNDNTACSDTILFDTPSACSNDSIACSILYLCGAAKPLDGDSWDYGIINYLDENNGISLLTPVLVKSDATGVGTYDPNNSSTPVSISFSDYDLILVSSTTENHISNDMIDTLRNFEGGVLNSNLWILDDLGMVPVSGEGYRFQTHAYINNTDSVEMYNYDNDINPTNRYVITKGNYFSNADAYLWVEPNGDLNENHGAIFHYLHSDVLPGVPVTHGTRTYLGFHANGIYANAQNGGALPAPASSYFSPEKHLTLEGKAYFDLALTMASSSCIDEICNNGIDDNGNGDIDCFDSECDCNRFLCDDNIFQTIRPDTSTIHYFYRTETDPVSITELFSIPTYNINSLAFNPVDGFIYGVGDRRLLRLDANGNIQDLGLVAPPCGYINSGGMGPDGEYYLGCGTSGIYQIDITTLALTHIADTDGHIFRDLAVSPIDGDIYFWSNDNRQLARLNISTGVITLIGTPNPRWRTFGTLVFKENGDIIAYGDDGNSNAAVQETLVRIDATTGVVTPIGVGPETNANDGCSCAYGISITKAAPDSVCVGTTMSYTFDIYNRTKTTFSGITFEDALENGLQFSSNPYSITGGLTITGTSNGVSLANLTLDNIPIGQSSFVIDIEIPLSYSGSPILANRVVLSNLSTSSIALPDIIYSDDPNSLNLEDSTETVILSLATSDANLTACDNSNETGSGVFFLHDANPQVTTESGVIISYHNNLSDAQNGISELVSPYTSSDGTVYVRVEQLSTGCFDTAAITLDVGVKCPENCHNKMDEDGDGLVDCNDPDCPCCKSYAPTLNNLGKGND